MTKKDVTAVFTAACNDGRLTVSQYAELQKLVGINWLEIIKLLPLLSTFFPALTPLLALLTPLLPFIQQIIDAFNKPSPAPTPGPVPIDDGNIPTPVV